jgi:hypothetical protein
MLSFATDHFLSLQKALKEAKVLRKSINAQLAAVDEHISAIKSMGTGWEFDSRESLDKCVEAKLTNLHAFNRWHSVWPALQVVLNSDTEAPAAVSALASLQGFVHEWVTLRTLACDIRVSVRESVYLLSVLLLIEHLCVSPLHIQTISESHSRGGKSVDATAHAFKLALTNLKTRANDSSSKSVADIFKLKREVASLEKQRRQLRGLFLDLSYALEEDCSAAMLSVKQMVMASHDRHDPQRQTPLDGGNSVDSVEVNLSTHGTTPLGPDSALDPIVVKTGAAVAAQRHKEEGKFRGGRGGGGPPVASPVTLTQKWLEDMHLKVTSALGKGITMALSVKDPSVFNTANADHKQHSHGNRRASKTETRVPFGHMETSDPKYSQLVEGNNWKQLSGEELRAALVALETRSGWGQLQLAATKYMSQCLSSAETEWFYLMEKNASHLQAGEALETELRNGITISVEGESGDIRHTYPLTRPGTTAGGAPSSAQGGEQTRACTSEAADILSEGIDKYRRVVAFRRLMAQSAFASNSFAPAPPQLVVLQTMKAARGPVVRHQASVYQMKKSEQDRIVAELMNKPPKGEKNMAQFTPKMVARKRKVNSQIDRNLRKTERMQRVKTLVRKFQASAESISKSLDETDKSSLERPRGAVVEPKERFHIPRFVPKLDSFEELASVRPSEIMHRSRSKVSNADTDSSDEYSDEDTLQLLGEVANAELDHITNTSLTGARLKEEGEEDDVNEEESGGGGVGGMELEKYSMMERLIAKEVGDQVITQLTLRMGGDAINVVVYWQPKEESLKINAFCFAG